MVDVTFHVGTHTYGTENTPLYGAENDRLRRWRHELPYTYGLLREL